MKGAYWLLTLGVSLLLLAGCGGGSDSVETAAKPPPIAAGLRMTIDDYSSPANVGVLTAKLSGYWDDAGLGILVSRPSHPRRPLRYLNEGLIDVAISHQPQVVLEQERGMPIVAIGSLVSRSTAAMIWLKGSGVERISDLKGKTIAIPGLSFQRAFLGSVLRRAGLTLSDVKVDEVGYRLVPALVSGQADAIFGASWNLEGVRLEAQGLEPVVTRVQSLGMPPYDELVVVTRRDYLSEQPQTIRVFMSALSRATTAAVENPKRAIDVIERSPQRARPVNRKVLEGQIEATLPLLSESGYMDPDQADRLVEWMQAEGMIEQPQASSELLTNEFLPRSGQ